MLVEQLGPSQRKKATKLKKRHPQRRIFQKNLTDRDWQVSTIVSLSEKVESTYSRGASVTEPQRIIMP